jgi:hypothetical protein
VPRGEQVKSDADIHYDDGIWLLEGYKKGAMLRTSIITDPADGRIPPLTAEGQKRAQARAEARKLVGPFDSAQARSLSSAASTGRTKARRFFPPATTRTS